MSRHRAFSSPGRPHPFFDHEGIYLDHKTINGVFPFFNPTEARFTVDKSASKHPEEDKRDVSYKPQAHVPSVALQWRSRDNRKGLDSPRQFYSIVS